MRVAFFSPLPPARSGIADYSEALLEALAPLVDVETFSDARKPFDPSRFDAILYQIGNNGFHDFVYETALRHPGIVVMHESNLHHLIADLTIRRGDWDAYVRECEYNGGDEAREFAERVRKLEVGPDYDLPMTRRLLESARGVIVHSRFMETEIRAQGFSGPIHVIPHGAWIPEASRNESRLKLGLDESTPLAGIFGFLKPYKRITESLRAFRRLVRLTPNARMILVGEPHPDFPIEPMIRSMHLSSNVRLLGFAPMEDFVGYLAACDIVLNLRYPTVGESSGTLLRSLGLGKAVLVSDIGAFAEFPEDVCLKVPVGAGEEDLIFEYLNLLISRPEVARTLGARAKAYVTETCNWANVAKQYALALSGAPPQPPAPSPPPLSSAPAAVLELEPNAHDDPAYFEDHRSRFQKTLDMTPPGGPCDCVLEMGAYMQITPALHNLLGYGYVRGCYYGTLGRVEHKSVTTASGDLFECDIDLFDAEKDRFPYPDAHFSTVLCCELIEHLFEDPMHLMSEVNRVLKPGGHLVLTTPNVTGLRALSAILQGYHPGFFPAYIRPAHDGETEARHNREYTPREIHRLLENAGFEVTRLETGEFRDVPHPEFGWVLHLLEKYRLETDLRGDGIYAVGRKTGPVQVRYPEWLYS
jgi:glycosyltransferase involved in cell wall biosynthesis/SAM-dependent methyltransferase